MKKCEKKESDLFDRSRVFVKNDFLRTIGKNNSAFYYHSKKKDTPKEKWSSQWSRTTKPHKARIKAIFEEKLESDCLQPLRITGCASAHRGSKTCP
jgi:hypothetical protein